MAVGYRRLVSSLAGEPNDICSLSESKSYCWLINTLQAEVVGFGIEPIVYSSGPETPYALSDTGTADDASDAGTGNQFSDTDTTDPVVGSKLDFYSWFYWTALHVAARRGDDELSELLLDSGASISPLLRCTEPPAIMRTFEYPIDHPYLQTPLFLAVAAGHCSTVQLLVRYGAHAVVSNHCVTALHVAAAHGFLDVCKFLVENDANSLDGRTESGLFPFNYAAAAGMLTTTGRYLWERGAEICASYQSHFPGNPKSNALTHALYSKRYSDALMLLDMDPDFCVRYWFLEHPLRACLFAPDICAEDEEHIVPIFKGWVLENCDVPRIISISGNLTIARLLIRHGASFDAPRYGGRRKLFHFGKTRSGDWYTRHRRRNHTLDICEVDNNVFFMVCSKPDMEGAHEMLCLALGAAGQSVGRLLN